MNDSLDCSGITPVNINPVSVDPADMIDRLTCMAKEKQHTLKPRLMRMNPVLYESMEKDIVVLRKCAAMINGLLS